MVSKFELYSHVAGIAIDFYAWKAHSCCLVITERGAKMQMWTRIGSHRLNTLLRNRRFPRRPDMTINVPGLKSPVNMDDNYGLRLTTYYRVRTHSIP